MARYISNEEKKLRPGISYARDRFGTGNYRVFYSSSTFEVPLGIGSVRATLLGAGGGPGGSFSSTSIQGCINCSNLTCVATIAGCNCVTIAHQIGGGGSGGAFVIGTAPVTAGCLCCIVVGAGGSAGTNATCHTTPTRTNGSAGGFTCAFGICASGGAGGTAAACVCGASGNNTSTWASTVTPAAAPTTVASSGNIYNANGNAGSAPLGTASICGTNEPTCRTCLVFGGASGSPLGTPDKHLVANPLESVAFDGTSSSNSLLEVKYDIPTSLYPGQIIYSQSDTSFPVGSTCKGSYWRSTNLCENYCSYYQICNGYCTTNSYYGSGYAIICTYSQSVNTSPGCGGGGLPYTMKYSGSYSTSTNNCCFASVTTSGSRSGGNGYAVVEW